MRAQSHVAGLVLVCLVLLVAPAAAQPIGTFRWQLFPFCNVVTLSIQQILSAFVLVGSDDQCGGSQPAAAVGTAVLQADGNARFGLTTVSPGGVPAHTEATVNPGTLGGTWRDGEGNTGAFLPNPPAPATGGPRPAPMAAGGALGAGVVTTALLAPGAVTTDRLGAGAVVAGTIAPGAVGAAAVNPAEIPRLNAANAFNGLVTATGFSGNGSALTSLPASQLVGVIPSEAWHEIGAPGEPAFGGGWQNGKPPYICSGPEPQPPGCPVYNTAAFYKDALGVVHLKGTLQWSVESGVAFRLPPGYRPVRAAVFPAQGTLAGCPSEICRFVLYDGFFQLAFSGGIFPATYYFSIDGITFRAEN